MKDFTSGSIVKHILRFSAPMLIGNLFQQAYSMVDAIVVGRFVGSSALAAVGVAMQLLQFLLSAFIGLTTGASVIVSQFYGAKEQERLERTVSTSILFLAALSVGIAALGVIFSPAFVSALGAPLDTFEDAVRYTRILMGGMVFSIFYNMYTAYLRSLGDSRSPLLILIFCTALNTGLDLLFVVGFQMAVTGVAVATVIAQSVSAVLCYLYVRRYVPLLHIKKLVFERALFKKIVQYGAPAALQLSLVSLAGLSITRLINSFGTFAMAGITAAAKVDQFAILPVSTISMALSSFAAQNIGAGLEERAKRGFRASLLLMLVIAVGISCALIALGPRLISLFLNEGDAGKDAILKVGSDYLRVMVAFYFLFAFLFAFNGFFRGVGDAVIAMAFPVASLTLRMAAAYLFVGLAGMGPEALAWSIPIGWGLCSLASWFYYRKRLWAGKGVVRRQ